MRSLDLITKWNLFVEPRMRDLAVVTGTSGAIGKSIAERFFQAGYLVCGIDWVEVDDGNIDLFIKEDLQNFVSNSQAQEALLSKIRDWAGDDTLDALINNAAYQFVSQCHPIPVNELVKSYNINAIAPYLLTTNLACQMTQGTGSVVNIGSIHSRLTKPGFLAYAATKAALATITRGLALDYADRIRVNCIEPASIQTPMLLDGFKDSPEKLRTLQAFHPQQRIGTPAEVAELAFQISSGKLRFLHGSCIDMSGGIACRLHDPA